MDFGETDIGACGARSRKNIFVHISLYYFLLLIQFLYYKKKEWNKNKKIDVLKLWFFCRKERTDLYFIWVHARKDRTSEPHWFYLLFWPILLPLTAETFLSIFTKTHILLRIIPALIYFLPESKSFQLWTSLSWFKFCFIYSYP